MIASDLNNPNFVGATNPDSRLRVEFFRKPIQNNFRSEEEGRPIFEDVDFIKIWTPGDTLSIIEAPVREDHKARFPQHWAHFMNTNGATALQVGTPIDKWGVLSLSQVAELKALKFDTVEAIANASDANLGKIGMLAGKSPYAFRDDAKRFLNKDFKDEVNEELEAQKAVNRALQDQLKAMQEQLAKLTQDKPKRGPKPKVKVEE